MELDDSILQKIRDLLGNSSASFSIFEHQVDLSVQMEYFEFSKDQQSVDDVEALLGMEPNLYSSDIELSIKKSHLVSLASIDRPEAYRILERFSDKAPDEPKDWAIMALQESRMLLETKLLDEQQVFISTGMGGKTGRLRYFVVVFPISENGFSQTQEKLIESEFTFCLKRFHAEVEEFSFDNKYASMVVLVPLSVQVKKPFQLAIDECNSLGDFIQQGFLITNVKVLSEEEIDEIINRPPDELSE